MRGWLVGARERARRLPSWQVALFWIFLCRVQCAEFQTTVHRSLLMHSTACIPRPIVFVCTRTPSMERSNSMTARQFYYFTEFTVSKGIFYSLVLLYVVSVCIVVVIEIFTSHECETTYSITYENPAYIDTPCRHTRYPLLLFLTPDECAFGRRLLVAVLLGGIIGWERRQADRPAGIRTMSLVALGSCLFTICSAFAFLDGPMAWDASRVSAAIPSGVGFLGAGLIFKEAEKDKKTEHTTHVVHGLTTAASLWLSAAVGVACGGELYFAASFAIAIMLALLRFGPRASFTDDHEEDGTHTNNLESGYLSTGMSYKTEDREMDPMVKKSERSERGEMSKSIRQRPHIGSMV